MSFRIGDRVRELNKVGVGTIVVVLRGKCLVHWDGGGLETEVCNMFLQRV